MKDPLWRTVLNWGTVITFFTLPITIMCIQLYAHTHPNWWQHTLGEPQRFQYLYDFMRNITILVFGLAGLRTWENLKNGNGKHPHEEHYEKRVIKSQKPPREEVKDDSST